MSSTSDKIKGLANEARGTVTQNVGKIIGNPKLEAEGALQKRTGQAQQVVGEVKDIIKSAIDKA